MPALNFHFREDCGKSIYEPRVFQPCVTRRGRCRHDRGDCSPARGQGSCRRMGRCRGRCHGGDWRVRGGGGSPVPGHGLRDRAVVRVLLERVAVPHGQLLYDAHERPASLHAGVLLPSQLQPAAVLLRRVLLPVAERDPGVPGAELLPRCCDRAEAVSARRQLPRGIREDQALHGRGPLCRHVRGHRGLLPLQGLPPARAGARRRWGNAYFYARRCGGGGGICISLRAAMRRRCGGDGSIHLPRPADPHARQTVACVRGSDFDWQSALPI